MRLWEHGTFAHTRLAYALRCEFRKWMFRCTSTKCNQKFCRRRLSLTLPIILTCLSPMNSPCKMLHRRTAELQNAVSWSCFWEIKGSLSCNWPLFGFRVKYEDLRVYSTQRCEMPFSKPLRYETWPPFKRGTYTKAAHAPIHVNSSVRKVSWCICLNAARIHECHSLSIKHNSLTPRAQADVYRFATPDLI